MRGQPRITNYRDRVIAIGNDGLPAVLEIETVVETDSADFFPKTSTSSATWNREEVGSALMVYPLLRDGGSFT